MTRLDDILEMLKQRESHLEVRDMEALISWMGERPDEEVIELLKVAATELAWRSTGGHADEGSVYPSGEVFFEATEEIAKVFYERMKVKNRERA